VVGCRGEETEKFAQGTNLDEKRETGNEKSADFAIFVNQGTTP